MAIGTASLFGEGLDMRNVASLTNQRILGIQHLVNLESNILAINFYVPMYILPFPQKVIRSHSKSVQVLF